MVCIRPRENLLLRQRPRHRIPQPLGKLPHLPARHPMHLPPHALQHRRLLERRVPEFVEHGGERLLHRLPDLRADPQSPGDFSPNRLARPRPFGVPLPGQDLRGDLAERAFRQVVPRLHGLLHHFAQRRLAALADDLFAGVGQHQLDLGAHLRVERRRRFVLGIGGGRVLLRRTQRRLDPAADFAQDDPLLADFMVRQETAGQQGVAAVVDGQVGQGRAAAAGDEEDQSRPVPVRFRVVRRPWAASPGPGAGRPC